MTWNQDVIVVVWDFDKTLVPQYMQQPLFEAYNIDENQFWKEVNELPGIYEKQGVKVNRDTVYLNHLLSYVQQGRLPGLTNARLRQLGEQIEFFPGLPDFFKHTKELIENTAPYSNYAITVEHYIVSTGLAEIIKGSAIYPYVDGIWGCEFMEGPAAPGNSTPTQIASIGYSIDNTTKTRALFEISKGVNKYPEEVNVNQRMHEEDRRVPFENMIYVADGPSDVPAFSVVKKSGGKTFAVYQQSPDNRYFKQAKKLLEDQRVDLFAEADYRQGTLAYLWLTEQIKERADHILGHKKLKLSQGKNSVPGHI